jgi:hypothetical protein
VSTDLHGGDEVVHLESANATQIVPSPDGRWIAFAERYHAYVMPFPQAGRTVRLGPDTRAYPVARISRDAGMYLHWSEFDVEFDIDIEIDFEIDFDNAFDFEIDFDFDFGGGLVGPLGAGAGVLHAGPGGVVRVAGRRWGGRGGEGAREPEARGRGHLVHGPDGRAGGDGGADGRADHHHGGAGVVAAGRVGAGAASHEPGWPTRARPR